MLGLPRATRPTDDVGHSVVHNHRPGSGHLNHGRQHLQPGRHEPDPLPARGRRRGPEQPAFLLLHGARSRGDLLRVRLRRPAHTGRAPASSRAPRPLQRRSRSKTTAPTSSSNGPAPGRGRPTTSGSPAPRERPARSRCRPGSFGCGTGHPAVAAPPRSADASRPLLGSGRTFRPERAPGHGAVTSQVPVECLHLLGVLEVLVIDDLSPHDPAE